MSDARKEVADALTPLYDMGVRDERQRIIALLIEHKVIRIDALGSTVFVNCDTLEVEYLKNALINGEHDGKNI